MKQRTFASMSFDANKKRTRREEFLKEMEKAVPLTKLLALIEPHYPTEGRTGRQSIPYATMLRIYLMQQWYAMSDPGIEDALYEIESMRLFASIELNEQAIPDETTILKFRRALEQHNLTASMLEVVIQHLGQHGLTLRQGTIIDATIFNAPSSIKNRDKARDLGTHQTRKGQQYYFGMKAHIAVDAASGLVHTVTTTPANTADVVEAEELLHGQESVVYASAGYRGAENPSRGRRGRCGSPVHWRSDRPPNLSPLCRRRYMRALRHVGVHQLGQRIRPRCRPELWSFVRVTLTSVRPSPRTSAPSRTSMSG